MTDQQWAYKRESWAFEFALAAVRSGQRLDGLNPAMIAHQSVTLADYLRDELNEQDDNPTPEPDESQQSKPAD